MDSIKFNDIYINEYCSIGGPMEKMGKIKSFDYVMDDYYFGTSTFENAEVKMQRIVIDKLFNKNKDVNLLIGGDLSNQIAITNYVARTKSIPFLGVYNACATFAEEIIVAANMLSSSSVSKVLTVVSSHNLNAEKQFRYPVEYGAPRKLTSTFTATGAVSTIVSKQKSDIKVEACTMGRVIDMGITDVNNMGAVMAAAAVNTFVSHLNDMNRKANYYDLVLTGDLGEYGALIFLECLKQEYGILINNYTDAGTEIFSKVQETYAGASGPVALPLVLFNKVLLNKKLKKILILATGSLHSPGMVNQKNSIPAICHAISLEVNR